MLNAARSLSLSAQSAPELPRVPGLKALYDWGCRPRKGEVVMVAGRSGTQKSGFALWWTSQMNLPTLYFSADMTPYEASIRLACSVMGLTTDEVEERMSAGGRAEAQVMEAVGSLNMTLSFGAITWPKVDAELEAYIELHDQWPDVIVIDNLMDIEGGSSDYTAQMEAMSEITDLARFTGSTVIVLHHATDKSQDARMDPYKPPARHEIKGGMAEKPQLVLSVALDPYTHDFHIATLKQRQGRSDQQARSYATLTAYPAMTRFGEHIGVYHPRPAETTLEII